MNEKNLVILGIIILTLACFGIFAFVPVTIELAGPIGSIFDKSILALGSLATGVAIGSTMKKKNK